MKHTDVSIAAAPAENMADERLTATAICPGSEPPKIENIRAVRVHTGLPGGCPTSRRAAVTRYSGQSQSEASGSRVSRYTIRASTKVSQQAERLATRGVNRFMMQI